MLNFFGPKRSGELAVAVSVPTVIVVLMLGLFTVPHLGEAWHNVKPLVGGFWQSWTGFVSIVLAVSGVEAIANATSVMKLDPGSSDEHHSRREERYFVPAIGPTPLKHPDRMAALRPESREQFQSIRDIVVKTPRVPGLPPKPRSVGSEVSAMGKS